MSALLVGAEHQLPEELPNSPAKSHANTCMHMCMLMTGKCDGCPAPPPPPSPSSLPPLELRLAALSLINPLKHIQPAQGESEEFLWSEVLG